MKRVIYVVVSFLVLALFIAGCSLPKSPDEIAKTDINSVLDKLQTNMKSENVAQVVDCFTDPYVDNGESITHEQLAANLPIEFGYVDYDIYEFINRQITVSGTEAEVIIDLHVKAGADETTVSGIFSLTKTNSGWKISECEPNN